MKTKKIFDLKFLKALVISIILISSIMPINVQAKSNSTKMSELVKHAEEIAKGPYYYDSGKKRNSTYYYDCSSLVHRLYSKHFSISTPSTTYDYTNKKYDKYRVGKASSTSLKVGDVLWRGEFKTEKVNGKKKKVWHGHVTIYIGNGKYVAAHCKKKNKADEITKYTDSKSAYTYVYRFVNNK